MDLTTLIVLFIYLLGVVIVFNIMGRSLKSFLTIGLHQKHFNQQLTVQQLTEQVSFKFKFSDYYHHEPLPNLTLEITNNSLEYSFTLLCEQMKWLEPGEKPKKAIRWISGMTRELTAFQLRNVIPPQETVPTIITLSDRLKANDAGILMMDSPLIKYEDLATSFEEEQTYQLSLCLEKVAANQRSAVNPSVHQLTCEFQIKRLPLLTALDWRPRDHKKKKK
ncbi:MAG: hypothetical protein HC796_01935 [Synechococcaceae cyanobacterium RL_1_2]|nr:hypothetical protein [Synechococcaceae cyanobacterium RL_1_2]